MESYLLENIFKYRQFLQLEQLSSIEKEYLSRWTKESFPQLNELWTEMDRIWDEYGLDNTISLANQNIDAFYAHPVWLLNGFFTAIDPESQQHRKAIAHKISSLNCRKIGDFGGGFGELARIISSEIPQADIDIIEPYPSNLCCYLTRPFNNIKIRANLTKNTYDCVVAQDVLEHLEDPLELVRQLVLATAQDGFIIFANCFHPVIKCHLPATFHLRHTFPWVVQPLGLNYTGRIEGAAHAQLFQVKKENINPKILQKRISLSRKFGFHLNRTCTILSTLKKKVVSKNIPEFK